MSKAFSCRKRFLDPDETSHCLNMFLKYGSIVYAPTLSLFFSRNRMIDSPSRFEDETWTVLFGCFQVEDLEYVGSERIAKNESVLRRRSCL